MGENALYAAKCKYAIAGVFARYREIKRQKDGDFVTGLLFMNSSAVKKDLSYRSTVYVI